MRLHRRSACVVVAVSAVSSVILRSLDASFPRHGVEDDGLRFTGTTMKGPSYPPVFANRYLLHLDEASTSSERIKLALSWRGRMRPLSLQRFMQLRFINLSALGLVQIGTSSSED
ncbi:hypothetical protein BHM03_00015428 [Ensete ventricosum]|nr:hypothetical protein BHM03_00015428 [Ensete ventricosum]